MANRELVVLGTASQAPTRRRNHNGYFLRWENEGLLFDPGEGTQRQMLFAGVTASQVTRICITHFHGDHCLGLPGVLARMSLDRVPHPVEVCYPAGSRDVFRRLRHASLFRDILDLRERRIRGAGPVYVDAESPVHPGTVPFRLEARALFNEANALFPGNPLLMFWGASLDSHDGDQEAALKVFHWLTTIDGETFSDDRTAFDRRLFGEYSFAALGACYFKLGRFADSAAWYGKAALANPESVEYRVKERLAAAKALSL